MYRGAATFPLWFGGSGDGGFVPFMFCYTLPHIRTNHEPNIVRPKTCDFSCITPKNMVKQIIDSD